jgi:hypothetical protein
VNPPTISDVCRVQSQYPPKTDPDGGVPIGVFIHGHLLEETSTYPVQAHTPSKYYSILPTAGIEWSSCLHNFCKWCTNTQTNFPIFFSSFLASNSIPFQTTRINTQCTSDFTRLKTTQLTKTSKNSVDCRGFRDTKTTHFSSFFVVLPNTVISYFDHRAYPTFEPKKTVENHPKSRLLLDYHFPTFKFHPF